MLKCTELDNQHLHHCTVSAHGTVYVAAGARPSGTSLDVSNLAGDSPTRVVVAHAALASGVPSLENKELIFKPVSFYQRHHVF